MKHTERETEIDRSDRDHPKMSHRPFGGSSGMELKKRKELKKE